MRQTIPLLILIALLSSCNTTPSSKPEAATKDTVYKSYVSGNGWVVLSEVDKDYKGRLIALKIAAIDSNRAEYALALEREK